MKWASENVWYKLGALGLALLVWYYVALQELTDIVRRVPLTVDIKNESLAIVGSPVHELIVTFAVPNHMLREFSEADISARHLISLNKAVEQYTFRIAASDIKVSKGSYRIRNIKPEEFIVRIDQLIKEKLPIRAKLQGQPAEGYKVIKEEIRLDPEEIIMTGPIQKLAVLGQVYTESIDVIGRTRSFRKKVRLQSYVDIRPLTENLEIEASIPITEEFGAKSFQDVPVRVLGTPFEMILAEVDPDTLTVDVTGPTRLLSGLETRDLLIYVDVSGLKRGEHEVAFGYTLPRELAFKHELPAAKVKIGEVKIK